MTDEELAAWAALEGKRFKAFLRGDTARAEELERMARAIELRALARGAAATREARAERVVHVDDARDHDDQDDDQELAREGT